MTIQKLTRNGMHFLAIELFSFLRPCLKKPQRPGITERVCDLRGLLSRKVRKTTYEVIKKYLWTHPKGNCDENESWLGVLASRFGAPASPFKNFLYKVNSGVGALGESDSVHCRKPFNERIRVHTPRNLFKGSVRRSAKRLWYTT